MNLLQKYKSGVTLKVKDAMGKLCPIRVLATDVPGRGNAFVAVRTDTDSPRVCTFDIEGRCTTSGVDLTLVEANKEPNFYVMYYLSRADGEEAKYRTAVWEDFDRNVRWAINQGYTVVRITSE